jgi:hypothetical protein
MIKMTNITFGMVKSRAASKGCWLQGFAGSHNH